MLFLIWLVVSALSLTVYLRKVTSRFRRHGVRYITPVPFLGNFGALALKKSHFVDVLQRLYSAFPDDRFIGRFDLMKPVIMLRDIDLIKQVTVKSFDHFLNHRTMVDATVDPLFGRTMFALKDQEWKDMRSTMSPAFTGAKMRYMVPFMVDASDKMIRTLKTKIDQSGFGYIDVDSKDLMTRYSNDVMASSGFGLKVDSHTDANNEIYLHAKTTAHLSWRRILVYLGYSSFPQIMKKLNVKFFKEEANAYFKTLFCSTMSEREEKKIFRPDIINLIMKAKKGNMKYEDKVQSKDAGFATAEESEVGRRNVNRTWSDNDLVVQAVFFFLASFETISSAICFLLHELAVNPDIQDRLVREFRDSETRNEGFDYSSIQELKYLDMVVSELFRFWPIGVDMDRICTKNFNLGKPNDKATSDYIVWYFPRRALQKSPTTTKITVPVWSLHYDLNYFPNPEKFDPERFSDENKPKIKPYTYLPFGSGPRCCPASRLVLCELKVMLYHMLLQFEVSPAEKTRIPVKLMPGTLLLGMEGGSWIRFKSRV